MPYPHLAPLDLGFVTLQNRVHDGLDAHGPRGSARRLRASSPRSMPSARSRRRRAHRHRRHRAQLRRTRSSRARQQLSFGWQVGKHRIDHRCRACCGRQASRCRSCMRGATRITRCRSRRRRSRSPITPFKPRGADGWGVRQHDRRLRRAARELAQARRLRRRRDHGIGGLSDQPVHRAADQPRATTHGAARSRTASASRWKSCGRTRESGTGANFIIIYRLSMLDLIEGGSTWDEVVALRAGGRAAPARRSSTPASAGTRRASRRSRRWCRAPRSPGSRGA